MKTLSWRRILLLLAVAALLLLAIGAAWRLYHRPTLALYANANLLANPGFHSDVDGDGRPDAWEMGPAAEVGDWTIAPDSDARSLRLTGSACYVRSAVITVWPGQRYRLSLQALTDAAVSNRLQAVFLWEDTRREVISRQGGSWLEVPARQWRLLEMEAKAPVGASGLSIILRPAGDDPVYVDDPRLVEEGVRLEPFPHYARAGLAFSLDWETAMGGLIHSRSADSYDRAMAETRGLAMRQGTENLLRLLERYDIQATWYAAGYSLLPGNVDGETFSGDPIYIWASQAHGWADDRWVTTPWFSDDPQGTAQSHPAWYFGDLVPRLLATGQEIQSHTFGHVYGGYVSPEELRRDLEQWNAVASEAGVTAAQSLAFPWGASLGMSDANYAVLEELGYLAVTRTYHESQGRSQYYILPPNDLFHLRTVPGHPQLWAFPDHYFPGHRDDLEWAKVVIDRVLQERGVTSLWAHSEEVVSDEQMAVWEELLSHAVDRRAEGLWIAPLTEIVRFRNALALIELREEVRLGRLEVTVRNRNDHAVAGLTLTLIAPVGQVLLDGAPYQDFVQDQVCLPELAAGQRVRLQITLDSWEAP